MAFAAGLRRPSGCCFPPSDAICTGGAIGKRPGVEPHPFVLRTIQELDRADVARQPSVEEQFWAEMQWVEDELASGAAATAVTRLESALSRLEDRLPSHLLGQLQLALGLSCATQARHDDAHRWYERCACALSARGAGSSSTTFVPVFNQGLQLAKLGRSGRPRTPAPPPSVSRAAPRGQSDSWALRCAVTARPCRLWSVRRCSSRRSPSVCEAPRCSPYDCSSCWRRRRVHTVPQPRRSTRLGEVRGVPSGAAAPAPSRQARRDRRRVLAR